MLASTHITDLFLGSKSPLISLGQAIKIEETNLFAHLGLAASYIQLGREEEAHAAAMRVLSLDPQFSLREFEKMIPLKDRDSVKNLIESLRKAGLS